MNEKLIRIFNLLQEDYKKDSKKRDELVILLTEYFELTGQKAKIIINEDGSIKLKKED